MQVTETLSEGLKRQIRIVVPAADLNSRLDKRLEDLRGRVNIRGFRPGKVPTSHIRRLYGKAAMAEIVQEVVAETSQQAIADRQEKPAMQPQYELTEDEEEANRIVSGEADLAFNVAYEVLPEFEVADFKGVKVERPVAEVTDAEIEERLQEIASASRPFEAKGEGATVENGDQVTLSYIGRIDGEPFEGGTDDNAVIEVGSGRFIPGFDEGLVGAGAGETRTVSVTFPDDYPAEHLKGRAAEFEVTIKQIAAPGELRVDDELAKRLGIEDVSKLRELVRDQIAQSYSFQTRQKVKRQILDKLDELHKFEVPPTLLEQEFENIWRQVTGDLERAGRTFEDEGTTEEAAREDYRKIAERRVRLGLVIARIGEKQEIKVSEEELQRALAAQMRQFPGQERAVYDFYRKNPEALASLRAPIFEDKVVDYLLELSEVTDKTVSKDELFADEDEEKTV